MQIVAALFAEDLEVREVEGPSTRLDIRGIKFSEAPSSGYPIAIEPHLFVIVRCGTEDDQNAVLQVLFMRDGEQLARNVQPLMIEPGKFAYRLVRAELNFDAPGVVEAHCSVDQGEPTIVPFTLMEPAE